MCTYLLKRSSTDRDESTFIKRTREEIRSAHSFEYSNDLRHLSMATEYDLYFGSDSKFDFRFMIAVNISYLAGLGIEDLVHL